MSRPARLAILSALAVLVIGAASLYWLHPHLSLPRAPARPAPASTTLRVGSITIRSVPLNAAGVAVVRHLVGAGVAIEEIDPAPHQQAEFGSSVRFFDVRTVDGSLVLGMPAAPAERPVSVSVCQRPDGTTWDVRINGVNGVDESRYPEWWLLFDGGVLLTTEAWTYAQLRNAGAVAAPCQKLDEMGVLHMDGLTIASPPLLPAEMDTLHHAIAAGLVPTEIDRVVGTPSGLFVHLDHGALLVAASCDDVRALSRALHLAGGSQPAGADFLGVGRLGGMAVATADPQVWSVIARTVGPC